jgi:phosphatidate cytidylyltransferase
MSPGKTWQGFAGGYICTLIMLLFFIYTYGTQAHIFSICLWTLSISTIALAGDLFESFLKRQANQKDSGHLLPGHGGLLDRLDAVLFVAIFFVIYMSSISYYLVCIQ